MRTYLAKAMAERLSQNALAIDAGRRRRLPPFFSPTRLRSFPSFFAPSENDSLFGHRRWSSADTRLTELYRSPSCISVQFLLVPLQFRSSQEAHRPPLCSSPPLPTCPVVPLHFSRSFEMAPDLLRDSTFGFFVNKVTNGHFFPHRDQQANYVVPARYLILSEAPTTARPQEIVEIKHPFPALPADERTLVDSPSACSEIKHTTVDSEKQREEPLPQSNVSSYPFLVDWEGEDDSDNPRCVFLLPSFRC
jgi:hypothetical protein